MALVRTRIAWTVGVLLLLLVAAALLLPRLFSEERVRVEVERRLTTALGLPVAIRGPVRVGTGLTTRLDAGEITIGGGVAGAPPLLLLGRIEASAATASLVRGALELGEVRLVEPRFHLHVDRDGRTNWAGLGGGSEPGGGSARAWSLAGLAIERGELRYTDERDGTDLRLVDWQLQAGRIALPEPFELQTRFAARRADAALATARLQARVTADVPGGRHVLEAFAADVELARAAEPLPMRAAFARLEYVVADDTATLRGLRVDAAGLALRADATVTQLGTAPVVDASLATDPFAPREVLRAFGVETPPMAGPRALDQAQLAGRVTVRDGSARLGTLDARIDDTRLTGDASVTTAAPHRWTVDLAADRIVTDRYLRPSALRDASPVELPLEFLRGLDVTGRLRVGELVAARVTLRDLSLDLAEEARRSPAGGARP
jgi:uncharacterized protein involved in outer membrane biogenesis